MPAGKLEKKVKKKTGKKESPEEKFRRMLKESREYWSNPENREKAKARFEALWVEARKKLKSQPPGASVIVGETRFEHPDDGKTYRTGGLVFEKKIVKEPVRNSDGSMGERDVVVVGPKFMAWPAPTADYFKRLDRAMRKARKGQPENVQVQKGARRIITKREKKKD